MEIKSVALLGAGAVGSYIIWGLSKLPDIRFGIIAEGSRAARLRDEGCTINNVTYHPQVWSPQEAKGVDLLIVALKYGALPGALASIREAVGPNTTVMSLMNGVDSEEIIAAKIGAEHVLPSLIKVASHKEADGYHFNPETTIGIIYGELAAPLKSERVQAVEALLAGTGIHSRVTPYIKEEIWSKFRLNVCNNLPAECIIRVNYRLYNTSCVSSHSLCICKNQKDYEQMGGNCMRVSICRIHGISFNKIIPVIISYSSIIIFFNSFAAEFKGCW